MLGPVELQHLFHVIDLPDQDIEKAKVDAGVNDVNMKAMKVLLRWRQYKGREATRSALLKALKTCNFNDVIRMLCQLWNIQGR